ncbi:WecB/TagA/CpsF family glycosyltransferase [bacterium]
MRNRETNTTPARHRVLGLPLDSDTLDGMTEKLLEMACGDSLSSVTYLNPDCVNLAFGNPGLSELYEQFDIVLADGIGVVWAARRKGIDIPGRAAITDLFPDLIHACADRGLKLFFLGAKPGVADAMAEKLGKKHPTLQIAGSHHGYFTSSEEKEVIAKIRGAEPDILIVAMGVPRQERWVIEHRREIPAKLCLCSGGVFDFYSESVPRAPKWMIRMHIEWLHRLIKDPIRLWRRYLIGNIVFIFRVLLNREVKR